MNSPVALHHILIKLIAFIKRPGRGLEAARDLIDLGGVQTLVVDALQAQHHYKGLSLLVKNVRSSIAAVTLTRAFSALDSS